MTVVKANSSCHVDKIGRVFKKGDRVLVGNFNEDIWERRYFSHMGKNGGFYCFIEGMDEWTSRGVTSYWIRCKKWVDKQ